MRASLAALGFALVGFGAMAQDLAPSKPVLDVQEVVGTMAGMQSWISEFRGRALNKGVSAWTFDAAMAGAEFLPDVIQKDRKQDEFTKTIWDYLDKAVSEDRIVHGQKALIAQKAVLDRIEAAYGVDREVVVAIWGLESAYGAVRGDIATVSALCTLAYDGRRADFFEAQLVEALRILQAGDVDPKAMVGSWAGAMGHTQFMPSSFQSLAVDFDGDGKRNIWGDDPTDALASTAAYLAKSGWKAAQPWAVEVTLPAQFDYTLAGKRTQQPLAAWQAMGLVPVQGASLPDQGWASLLLPAGARGPALLVFDNFSAIETYNVADAYVIAVGHLADRLKGAPPFQASWPRDLRVLTLEERIELQERLTAAGFDPFGVDGKVGPNTLAAVRKFQTARGLVPDAYPSTEILDLLREGAKPVDDISVISGGSD